ncbi:unnamed protein product [Rhizophagus irregularis]|nr:unnamed protein product [Rhizophagus irregularis]
MAEKEYRKSQSPITIASSLAESLPISLHSPHLLHTRTPMDEIENELVEAGISLPEKYFINRRYPKTSRPSARSPNKLSDPSGSSGLNIAASMDLSKYEINYKDYEDELIVCSSSEDEDEEQRTKGTPKKQSTNKRNI